MSQIHPPFSVTEPDSIARPVAVMAMGGEIPDWEMGAHTHLKSQLMVTQSGMLTVGTAEGMWVVPPRTAIWIPAGVSHSVTSFGLSRGIVVFLDSEIVFEHLRVCTVLEVSTFLNVLLERVIDIPQLYETEEDIRLMQVVVDEIAQAQQQWFYLPVPKDKRLKKLTDELIRMPDMELRLELAADLCHISQRTLTRLFLKETGLSLNDWKRRLHILLALQWLHEGKPVQIVAQLLGYESDSSFIAMFKKIMKSPPKKYLKQ